MTACDINQLSGRKCKPCEGGVPPIGAEQARPYLDALPGWSLGPGGTSVRKEWVMKDFVAAVELVGRIRDVAEADDHHPDLHLTRFRRLAVELSTHAIGGLSENDFILAAKIEKLPKSLKG